jgi:hypothetical protein
MSLSTMKPPRRSIKKPEHYTPNALARGLQQVNEGSKKEDGKDVDACNIWRDKLRTTWRRFSPPNQDWGFIPASLKGIPRAQITKNGTAGFHYALGWTGLAAMIEEHGVTHSPAITIDGVHYHWHVASRWGVEDEHPFRGDEEADEAVATETIDQGLVAGVSPEPSNHDNENPPRASEEEEDAVMEANGPGNTTVAAAAPIVSLESPKNSNNNEDHPSVNNNADDDDAAITPSPNQKKQATSDWDTRIRAAEAEWKMTAVAGAKRYERIEALEMEVFGRVSQKGTFEERLQAL